MISSHGVRVPLQVLHFDLPVMIGVSMACLAIFFTGLVIARWKGGLFLTYFVIYNFLLFQTATQSPHFPLAQMAIFGFVGPLTLLTLGILGLKARSERRESGKGPCKQPRDDPGARAPARRQSPRDQGCFMTDPFMLSTVLFKLAAIAAFIALSVPFVVAEFTLIKACGTRIDGLADTGKSSAEAARGVLQNIALHLSASPAESFPTKGSLQ